MPWHRLSPPLRPMPRLLPLLLVLAVGGGCHPAEGLVERAIVRELPERIGPAEDYRVEVTGLMVREGTAKRIAILGRRVRPDGAPVLDRLDLDLHGVRYDRDAGRLDAVARATATAHLLPADLADFLMTHRNVREATVLLQAPQGATLRLRPEIAGLAVPENVRVEITGRLQVASGTVRFEVESVRAAGLNLGRAAARRLGTAINPIVDLTDTDAGLRITDLTVRDGALTVQALADPATLTRR